MTSSSSSIITNTTSTNSSNSSYSESSAATAVTQMQLQHQHHPYWMNEGCSYNPQPHHNYTVAVGCLSSSSTTLNHLNPATAAAAASVAFCVGSAKAVSSFDVKPPHKSSMSSFKQPKLEAADPQNPPPQPHDSTASSEYHKLIQNKRHRPEYPLHSHTNNSHHNQLHREHPVAATTIPKNIKVEESNFDYLQQQYSQQSTSSSRAGGVAPLLTMSQQLNNNNPLTNLSNMESRLPGSYIANQHQSAEHYFMQNVLLAQEVQCQQLPTEAVLPADSNKSPNTKKTARQTYTKEQTNALEKMFETKKYVTKADREELKQQTLLNDNQIKVWFQNRRMKKKKIDKNEGTFRTDVEQLSSPLSSGKNSYVPKDQERSVAEDMNLELTQQVPQTPEDYSSQTFYTSPPWPMDYLYAYPAYRQHPSDGISTLYQFPSPPVSQYVNLNQSFHNFRKSDSFPIFNEVNFHIKNEK